MQPQLAEPLEIEDLTHYFTSDDWWLQPKLDGHRVLITVTDGVPKCANRKGELFKNPINPRVIEDFTGDHFGEGVWVFDGEYMEMDRHFYVFDLLETPNGLIVTEPLHVRQELLDHLFSVWAPFHIHPVPTMKTEQGKRDMFTKIEEAGGEGVMWKNKNDRYLPGRRSRGWLKTKLWKSADVIVTQTWREGRRSVALGLYDPNGRLVDVGACSMTDRNLKLVQPGSVIEVKYLYVGAGGNLFQPAFKRLRLDKTADECNTDQLRYVNKAIIS